MKKFLSIFLVLCFSLPAAAQDGELASMPGYVDFGSLSTVYGEPRVMINISGLILQFMSAAAAASKDEPEAAELMRSLKAVRVNVYDTAGALGPAREQIASVRAMLEKSAWQPVVQVNDSGEEVQIFMKTDDTGIQGLTVMTVDSEEAVFINILGQINPEQLNVVMSRLNLDVHVDASVKQE